MNPIARDALPGLGQPAVRGTRDVRDAGERSADGDAWQRAVATTQASELLELRATSGLRPFARIEPGAAARAAAVAPCRPGEQVASPVMLPAPAAVGPGRLAPCTAPSCPGSSSGTPARGGRASCAEPTRAAAVDGHADVEPALAPVRLPAVASVPRGADAWPAVRERLARPVPALAIDAGSTPLRVHVQWHADVAQAWIGLDAPSPRRVAAACDAVAEWIRDQGGRIGGLVCNGEPIPGFADPDLDSEGGQ